MASNAYRQEVRHTGLNKYRVITASTPYELRQKVAAQEAQWAEQWKRKQEAERKRQEREQKQQAEEKNIALAELRTVSAKRLQEALSTFLVDSLKTKELSFDDLKDRSTFDEPSPQQVKDLEPEPQPQRSDDRYNPELTFFTRHSKKRLKAAEDENETRYQKDLAAWEERKKEIEGLNQEAHQVYEQQLAEWKTAKDSFYKKQQEHNAAIDDRAAKFAEGEPDEVARFFDQAINAIKAPIKLDLSVASSYSQDGNTLVADVYLPTIEGYPTLKKVTYVKSRGEFKETQQPQAYIKRAYEGFIYQLVLRIVRCVFTASGSSTPEALVLNGRVHTIDASNGHKITPCILSVNTTREEFSALNLASIDPKAWFKSSKGIAAASIANITPVAPIMPLNREDKRFVEGYSVEGRLSEGDNLAAMDWQDFENLVRELFGEEFSVPGGEVKITRASRDGGVDAVAFDPDPIRGGKIIIQAKRYTNVVGVSAVRDLYGTVMNEGAMKGILVTTSSYGNDAYEFARGKPLTLINGAELLYLLDKHGHRARIDIKEAKAMLGEQGR